MDVSEIVTVIGLAGVLRTLLDAALPKVAASVAKAGYDRYQRSRKTIKLGAPQDLHPMVKSGALRPGQFVQGSGFFSLYTAAPEPQGSSPAGGIVVNGHVDILRSSQEERWITSTRPVTEFPSLGDARVGFLYPHAMWGFGQSVFGDASIESVPHLGRVLVVMRDGEWVGLENRIVSFRARLELITLADLRAIDPGFPEDVYKKLRRQGDLCFLNAMYEDGRIEDYEPSPQQSLFGSHFASAHWEIARDVEHRRRLYRAITAGLEETSRALGCMNQPPLHSTIGEDAGATMWPYGRLQVYLAPDEPEVFMRLRSDFRAEGADELAEIFARATTAVLAAVSSEFSLHSKPSDLDGSDSREWPNATILQSTAACSITEPLLVGARSWLEKRSTESAKNSPAK